MAGTDEQRASDVMGFFLDPSISAIVANRGGFGCGRMIDLLNYTAIAQHPKPIVGYSDLTALLTAIHVKTGLVTFHGPMGIDDWSNYNGVYFQQVIMQAQLPTFVIQVTYLSSLSVLPHASYNAYHWLGWRALHYDYVR